MEVITEEREIRPFAWRPQIWWREQCESIFFLCRSVLSSCWEDKFQNFGVLHEHLCRFLHPDHNKSSKKFVSVFRGSYKTTALIGMVFFLLTRALMRKKPISICYNTATKDNAENFMEDFRETVRECKLYHAIYPDGLPADGSAYRKWTKYKVEYKWVKFQVASLEEKQVSRHHTVIINDDLVNDDNAYSEGERAKVKRKWKFQKSILTRYKKHKIGLEVDVGTPFHSKDLISFITNRVDTYDKFIIPYQIDGFLTLPEMFEWDDFKELREEQGASIFSTQYELKVVEEEDQICKEEWLKYWKALPENYNRYMVVDPAGTEDKDNCPTGIIVCDVNESGTIFILHAQQYWLTPMKLLDLMDELREFYDPDEVYIEKEKYSITIADTVEHLAPSLNFDFVEHGNEPKEKRIHRLKQWFETKRILLDQGMTELEDQLIEYPDCRYKDLLDALAYVLKVMDTPKRGRKRTEEDDRLDEFEKEMNKVMGIGQIPEGERTYHDHIF